MNVFCHKIRRAVIIQKTPPTTPTEFLWDVLRSECQFFALRYQIYRFTSLFCRQSSMNPIEVDSWRYILLYVGRIAVDTQPRSSCDKDRAVGLGGWMAVDWMKKFLKFLAAFTVPWLLGILSVLSILPQISLVPLTF